MKSRIILLNGPCTRGFARTGRWQATSRGASLWYPIWLAHCHAVLEASGFEARLIDAPAYDYSLEDTLDIVRKYSPDLCVIDTSTASIVYDFETARQIKEKVSRQIKICFVGPHTSAVPDEVIENEFVDCATIDEYDHTVRDLAERLSRDPDDTMEGVAGLWYKRGGKVYKNPRRPLIEPLDDLPFASRSLYSQLDINRYRLDFCLHPYMDIMTSRGCPAKCTYCLWPQTLSRGKYRVRSLESVFAEIDFVLGQKLAVREIFFDDDTFTVNSERVLEFCDRYIRGGYGLPFSVNARANITDEKMLRMLKKAGLRCMVVGFESGNQHILDAVRKNTRLEEMEEFARLCEKAGIQVHGDFVIGLPGENHETVEKTVRFARRLPLSTFQLSIAMPLPGTEFYRWLAENDFLLTRDYTQWVDENGHQNCVVNYPQLSSREIEESVYSGIRSYYLSLPFLAKAARQVLSNRHELKRYLWGGVRLFQFLHQKR